MSEEVFRGKLKDLLDEYGKTLHEDGAMCTTFFVTAEFFDGDGKYWASTFYNDDSTPVWRITGLVQHALENDFTDEEGDEE
jgi:hypothetical protein